MKHLELRGFLADYLQLARAAVANAMEADAHDVAVLVTRAIEGVEISWEPKIPIPPFSQTEAAEVVRQLADLLPYPSADAVAAAKYVYGIAVLNASRDLMDRVFTRGSAYLNEFSRRMKAEFPLDPVLDQEMGQIQGLILQAEALNDKEEAGRLYVQLEAMMPPEGVQALERMRHNLEEMIRDEARLFAKYRAS